MSFFSFFQDDEEDVEKQAVLEYWKKHGSEEEKEAVSFAPSSVFLPSPSPEIDARVFTPEEEKAARLIAKVIMRRIRFKRFVGSLRKDRDALLNGAAAKIQSLCRMVLGLVVHAYTRICLFILSLSLSHIHSQEDRQGKEKGV